MASLEEFDAALAHATAALHSLALAVEGLTGRVSETHTATPPGRGRPEVEIAILEAIAIANCRLTEGQIVGVLKEHNLGTIRKALQRMRQREELSNSNDGHGNGYGLPDWH